MCKLLKCEQFYFFFEKKLFGHKVVKKTFPHFEQLFDVCPIFIYIGFHMERFGAKMNESLFIQVANFVDQNNTQH